MVISGKIVDHEGVLDSMMKKAPEVVIDIPYGMPCSIDFSTLWGR